MINRLLLCVALIFVSHSTYAVTSVCSVDTFSASGPDTLRHEATWSLYDNWFYNLHVQIHSGIDGPVSGSWVDSVEMNTGGQRAHALNGATGGEYTLHGQVHIGHPVEWGFDSYHTVECQPWRGYLAGSAQLGDFNLESPDEPAMAIGSASVGSPEGRAEVDAYIKRICGNPKQKTQCDQLLSLSEEQRAAIGEKLLMYNHPQRVATGFIVAMSARHITLRSTSGHYTQFTLSPQVALTRHRQALLSQVRDEDLVHVERAASAHQFARVMVLQSNVRDLPLYRWISDQADTVQPDTSQPDTTELADDTIVTVISRAGFSELTPIISYARVIASEIADGTLVVHRIEVLR